MGRFIPGNRIAVGNPLSIRVQELRFSLFSAVTSKDLTSIVKRLIRNAISGDVASAKLLFERIFGPPLNFDIIQRLTELEERLDIR